MEIHAAPWVFPAEGPPLAGRALLVSGGRVREVGGHRELARRWPGARVVDWPDCALTPALVNAHAHLELTGLGVPPAPRDFVEWVLEVIARKRGAAAGALRQGIRQGAAQCLALGQGVVADVVSDPSAWTAYPAEGLLVRGFPEVIAGRAADADAAVETAAPPSLREDPRWAGLSPHAPYTACRETYLRCWAAARAGGGRVTTHLAESAAEIAFCRDGGGPILERLYAAVPASPPPCPGAHPVDWLDRIGVLGPGTLAVHLVHLDQAQVERLARSGAKAVLCPRSNRLLSGRAAPGRALLDAGVTVALGTDSALSAGDLDLWQDVRCAVEDYGWSPGEALRAATLGGARALGLDGDRGALTPGRRADLVVRPLGPGADPWERLLGAGPPAAVWVGGRPAAGPAAG
ncbi:MAG: amidohydrolase family protein [Deferrisomatales bacterium]